VGKGDTMTTKVEQYNRRGKTKLETVKSPSALTNLAVEEVKDDPYYTYENLDDPIALNEEINDENEST
jgi:hypothetical protein